jgi:hypothetical protein
MDDMTMADVTLQIAGIIFRIAWNSWLPLLQTRFFGQFEAGNGLSDVYYHICAVERDSLILSPLNRNEREFYSRFVYDPQSELGSPILNSPEVRRMADMFLTQPGYVSLSVSQHAALFTNFVQREQVLFYLPEFGGYSEAYQCHIPQHKVTANLRQMFSVFLPQYAGFLMHSSGIIRDRKAAVFAAPDAGGKTTVLGDWTDGVVLNDDQVILRKEEDAFFAHATPLGRTHGPNQAILGGLFLLEQSNTFELVPLDPKEAIYVLWGEHQSYTVLLPKNLRAQAFHILCDICYQVPIFKMCFPENYVDWDAIDAAMK